MEYFFKKWCGIGQINVQPSDLTIDPSIRDVGWFIDSKYQGKGYATEAAIAVLNFMFNEVEIEKIVTLAAVINSTSWKLMEKLGFKRTGEREFTYFDENDNIINNYTYKCDKDSLLGREKKIFVK